MRFVEKVYDYSPIMVQNIMCTTKGYLQNRDRYGKEYWKYREYYKSIDTMSKSELEEVQNKKLKELLLFAVSHSEYYAQLYKNIDVGSIDTVDDLKKLPIVDKEMLRANIDKVMTIPKNKAVIQHTGGTTGKSLTIRQTRDDSFQRMAILDNFKSRVGFENLKMRRATFNGKHIVPPNQKKNVYWRYNASCKQMIYSSFHLTEENMKYYVDSLNEFKPQGIDGFFTSMCDVASYIERKSIQLKFRPIAIFPTSETLTDSGRELLERVFKCKVYNQYASSEGAPFITECPNQTLHMELATGVFEHLKADDDEVLVTSFTTHGTPLIRYRIGDRMTFPSNKECSCGLCGTIVDEIQGRTLDFLYTPNGAKINAGNVSNILKNFPNVIIRAQFIQDKKNEITVLLEVEEGKYTKKDEVLLMDEIMHKFGNELKVSIQVVDEILRESSGKYKMIINRVDDM